MKATYPQPAPELVFPAQQPFSWTLRGARARHRDKRAATSAARPYRITGRARDATELAAVAAFCERHAATLELDEDRTEEP